MQILTPTPSKSEQVLQRLRSAICSAELAPGERIVIDTLARQLGVSAIPVREALRQLGSEGLVELQPHVGARVSDVSAAQVSELFELLHALERLSVRAACRLATTSELEELSALVQRMEPWACEATSERSDEKAKHQATEAWCVANKQLHEGICTAAKMPLVRQTLSQAFDQWERIRRAYAKGAFVKRIHAAQAQHGELLAALCARDVERAERILDEHNHGALADYVSELEALIPGPMSTLSSRPKAASDSTSRDSGRASSSRKAGS